MGFAPGFALSSKPTLLKGSILSGLCFCQGIPGLLMQRSAPSGAVANFSREGGGRLAVRCCVLLGSGVAKNEGCAGQCQLACVPGWLRKRSEAPERRAVV